MKVARGELKRPHFPDPDLEMLIQRGMEHEKHYLEGRRKQTGGEVAEIAIAPPRDLPAWARAAEQTRAAMAQGPSIIYQATFCDDGWIGQADFLVRVETPSQLGAWSYEVVDTKLTTVTKARSIIQLCVYSELLARLQGQLPEHMHIVLGQDAGEESFRVADYLAYVRSLRRRFLERFQPGAAATYPDPVEHCKVCDFRTICDGQWRQDDHLSLVAGISRRQRERLTEAGVHTLTALGALPLARRPTGEDRHRQARPAAHPRAGPRPGPGPAGTADGPRVDPPRRPRVRPGQPAPTVTWRPVLRHRGRAVRRGGRHRVPAGRGGGARRRRGAGVHPAAGPSTWATRRHDSRRSSTS